MNCTVGNRLKNKFLQYSYKQVSTIVTGSGKTRHNIIIVYSMKFELAIILNSSTIELTYLQV